MQRRLVGGGWVRLMCAERLKAFVVWLIGWLRSDRMRDCRFNPQLLGYVCSRSLLQDSLFHSVFIIASLSAFPPLFSCMHMLYWKFPFWQTLFTPPYPFASSLFSLLPLACPLLQPCREIRWIFSAVLSHHCSLSLYGRIIFGETGRGWKKAANISGSVSLDFVCVCVRACVCTCSGKRARETEGDSLEPRWHIQTLRTFPFSKIALPKNANIFWRIPSFRCAAHSAVFPCRIKQANK